MDLVLSLPWEVLCFVVGYWTLKIITLGRVDLMQERQI